MGECSAFCGGLRLRKQSSCFRAGPIEVTDIAPDLFAIPVIKHGRWHDLCMDRAGKRHPWILVGAEILDSQLVEEGDHRGMRAADLADRDDPQLAIVAVAAGKFVESG